MALSPYYKNHGQAQDNTHIVHFNPYGYRLSQGFLCPGPDIPNTELFD